MGEAGQAYILPIDIPDSPAPRTAPGARRLGLGPASSPARIVLRRGRRRERPFEPPRDNQREGGPRPNPDPPPPGRGGGGGGGGGAARASTDLLPILLAPGAIRRASTGEKGESGCPL